MSHIKTLAYLYILFLGSVYLSRICEYKAKYSYLYLYSPFFGNPNVFVFVWSRNWDHIYLNILDFLAKYFNPNIYLNSCWSINVKQINYHSYYEEEVKTSLKMSLYLVLKIILDNIGEMPHFMQGLNKIFILTCKNTHFNWIVP